MKKISMWPDWQLLQKKKKCYTSVYIFLSVKQMYSSGNWVKLFLFLFQTDLDVPQATQKLWFTGDNSDLGL